MKTTNFKHVDTTCPECKHHEILMDPEQEIIYCTHCGLVLHENTIFKITHVIQKEQRKNRQTNQLWRKVHNPNIFKFTKGEKG